MYRQKAVCEREGVPFQSKVDLAEKVIREFEPLADTCTHVLIDSWYVNKRIWKAVKGRKWHLTGGLKKNHKLRITNTQGEKVWLRVDEYATTLPQEAFQPWSAQSGWRADRLCSSSPHQSEETGRVPGVDRQNITGGSWGRGSLYVTTRLTDRLEQVVHAMALRWTVETLFADFKELMGSDQYQLHSAEAILRFWALGLCLYQFLDSLRHRLKKIYQQDFTLGETLNWVRERNN